MEFALEVKEFSILLMDLVDHGVRGKLSRIAITESYGDLSIPLIY